MTWQHALIIILAMALVVACGFHPGCAGQMQTIGDISKMVIAGALGNAMGVHKAATAKREPT